MPRPLIVLSAVALAIGIGLSLSRTSASAHPLGNFTINHYDRIDVSADGISVYSVLDMAEIPAFQERDRVDANGDGNVDDGERAAYARTKATELGEQLVLKVRGEKTELRLETSDVSFPPGQGGLQLLRLTAAYKADVLDRALAASPDVTFVDNNDPDRIGWREIVLRSAGGVTLRDSSVPNTSRSAELTSYPQDALSSPLDVRSASFSLALVAGAAPDPAQQTQALAVKGNRDSSLSRFSDLIARDHLSPGVIAIALMLAMGFGAIHALSPGHGKTIVAAYLVGSKGTARHALLLGLTVTLTHTSSVYVLGFVAFYLSSYIVPDRLYPWLGISSGALVVSMGLALLVGRLRSSGLASDIVDRGRRWLSAKRPSRLVSAEGGSLRLAVASAPVGETDTTSPVEHIAHVHTGVEPEHLHDHGHAAAHSHGLGGSHSHAMPLGDGEAVTWRRLIGLGIFGGLLPCPSAIVVMLGAISLHRVGFGLVLIVFFSLGLAGVLTGIGFALVYGRQIAQRVPVLQSVTGNPGKMTELAIRVFPSASAAAVVIAGTLIALRAMSQL